MADGIKIGNTDISAFKVGSGDCKVYLGDTLLYPQSPTPVFEGKYKLTLSDSSTVSAECDGTSAVTSGEVASQYSGSVVSAEIGCVTSIGNYAFCNCYKLTSIAMSNNITRIDSRAFSSCRSLTSVTIPDSVTSIGQYAFNYCSGLTSCTIGSGVTSIGNYVFRGCTSLTSINIPSGVTSIGNNTFRDCTSLTSIDIPSGVTSIGTSAFYNCSGLTSIDIPSGVTSIGSYAFSDCSSLTSITINATTPPSLGSGTFSYGSSCNIYVPAESVEVYKTATNWSTYASRIQAIPNS